LVLIAAALVAAPAEHGILVANMDRSVAPGNDFFAFANGGWIARAAIPPDRSSTGVFVALADGSDQQTWGLIQGAIAAHPASGTEARQIADLAHAYMDVAGIDERGAAPLRHPLAAIAAINDRAHLASALGAGLRADVDPLNNTNFQTPNLLGLWVAPGFHDPARNYVYLLQGGLEMPSVAYYLADSAGHAPTPRCLSAPYRRQARFRRSGSGGRARGAGARQSGGS